MIDIYFHHKRALNTGKKPVACSYNGRRGFAVGLHGALLDIKEEKTFASYVGPEFSIQTGHLLHVAHGVEVKPGRGKKLHFYRSRSTSSEANYHFYDAPEMAEMGFRSLVAGLTLSNGWREVATV